MNLFILVVEDSPDDLFLIERLLRHQNPGLQWQVASNGQEAIDYLSGTNRYRHRSACPLPQLVISNLNMPLVDGLELVRWLREQPQFSALPVLLLSSSVNDATRELAEMLGVTAFAQKPLLEGLLVVEKFVRAASRSAMATSLALRTAG